LKDTLHWVQRLEKLGLYAKTFHLTPENRSRLSIMHKLCKLKTNFWKILEECFQDKSCVLRLNILIKKLPSDRSNIAMLNTEDITLWYNMKIVYVSRLWGEQFCVICLQTYCKLNPVLNVIVHRCFVNLFCHNKLVFSLLTAFLSNSFFLWESQNILLTVWEN
jgi:hypothetical protein